MHKLRSGRGPRETLQAWLHPTLVLPLAGPYSRSASSKKTLRSLTEFQSKGSAFPFHPGPGLLWGVSLAFSNCQHVRKQTFLSGKYCTAVWVSVYNCVWRSAWKKSHLGITAWLHPGFGQQLLQFLQTSFFLTMGNGGWNFMFSQTLSHCVT